MEIPIGRKYVITSDSLCYTLNEKKKFEKGKNKGKEYLYPIAYYNTIENCLDNLIELNIKESDATNIKELMKDIKNISKFIREQFSKAKGKTK